MFNNTKKNLKGGETMLTKKKIYKEGRQCLTTPKKI